MPITADDWADRFGELRERGALAPSAWLGIPLVVMSLIGILWSVPVPAILRASSPVINYGTLFVMATFVYYCILSLRLALGGLFFLIAVSTPSAWLAQAGQPLWPIASGVFVLAFCWQLIETWHATGRMLIGRNLQYLMLGPIWLLRAAYRGVGIAY
jgi:hypothetical protein